MATSSDSIARPFLQMSALLIHATMLFALLLSLHRIPVISAQDTLRNTGCTFQDGPNTYNIELRRGLQEQPCTSTDSLSDQFKNTEKRTLELAFEISQLQGHALRLMEYNLNLTRKVESLQDELRVTKEALRLHQAAAVDCPPLYTIKSENFKSCYMFVGRELTWYDSETFCMSTGGHLVALETDDEMNFVTNYIRASKVLPGQHMWTGGNDIAQEDHWMWAGLNQELNFTKWLLYPHVQKGPIQMPDNHLGEEHCVHLFHLHDYDWNDIYCGYKFYFICEYKLV